MTDLVEVMAVAVVGLRARTRNSIATARNPDTSFFCPGDPTEDDLDEMRAALQALNDAGYAVVPRVPTEAMVQRGITAELGATVGERAANCYRAMIAAEEE